MALGVPARSPAAARVLNAALESFAKYGYARTTVAQIERAAGLTPGAGGIYRHFASKTDLLEQGVREHLARLDAVHAVPHDDRFDLRDALTLYVRAGLVMIRSQRPLIRLLYRDLEGHPTLFAEVKRRLVYAGTKEFADRLRELAKQAGSQRADRLDHEAVATIFAGAITNIGVVEAVLDTPPPVDDDRLVTTWVDVLHDHLAGNQ